VDAERWTEKDADAWWAERPELAASENGSADTMDSHTATAAHIPEAAAPTLEITREEEADDH
jgi:hypothetical protein